MMTTADTAYRDFHQQLSRYISRRLGNADDVQDILQEVFVRVLRNEAALSEARAPLAWLYTVTRSVIIDHFRKSGREFAVPFEPPETDADMPDPEFERCIGPLLGNLPDKYRKALQFTDMDGGQQTEFAQISGQNLSTVKSQVQRGRKMLKDAIIGCCKIELDTNNRVIDVYGKDNCC